MRSYKQTVNKRFRNNNILKIHRGTSDFPFAFSTSLTTGTFDGVHKGHRAILQRLTAIARETKTESVLLTFEPHPRKVIFPDSELWLLNSPAEKMELLRETGIDHVVVHPFDREFSRLTALQYVRDLLVRDMGASHLVMGYDHHFGRNREGGLPELRKLGEVYDFEVTEIPAQDVDEVNVSSTKIREAVLRGDIRTANEYLTSPYRLMGEVVRGRQVGRDLGFPTANIQPDHPDKLIPADGVYVVDAVLPDGTFQRGVMNIGVRPSFEHADRTVEVHLLGFEGDLYGQPLQTRILDRIRGEQRFESLEALGKQIQEDAAFAGGYHPPEQ